MRIEKISCDQFAGARDVEVCFAEGMNIVYGKNESGKSTLVNLLLKTLFQKAKLNKKTDKDFISSYFPSGLSGASVIDGKVKIASNQGEYVLSKEWGEEERVSLSAPEGVYKNQEEADERLKEVLLYGEGVYSQMLFPSWRGADGALKRALDGSLLGDSKEEDFKTELTKVLTQAFYEGDGISLEEIAKAIDKKIKEVGNYWDIERDEPLTKRDGGRYINSTGEVYEAYFTLERKKRALYEAEALQEALDRAEALYEEKCKEEERAKGEPERFEKYAQKLEKRSEMCKRIKSLSENIARYKEALQKWPLFGEQIERAKTLDEQRKSLETKIKFTRAKEIYDGLELLKAERSVGLCPSERDIADAKTLEKEISALENRLRGMDICAQFKMYGENALEIKSLRTGEKAPLEEGRVTISEAVEISVPGVMEMSLSPAGLDVQKVNLNLKEQKEALGQILKRYGAKSAEELSERKTQYLFGEEKLKSKERELAIVLGGESFQELRERANSLPLKEGEKEEISAEIFALCGREDISAYIAGKLAIIGEYQREFKDRDALQEKLSEAQREYESLRAAMEKSDPIPQEYLFVSDAEKFLQNLKSQEKRRGEEREEAFKQKARAESALEQYQSRAGDLKEALQNAQEAFARKREELYHWVHIKEVFDKKRGQMTASPMHDLATGFANYLALISGGKVSSRFPDEEKLDVNIYSGGKLIDYVMLSEGTKETVALAYRLAVIDHLFPQGGGVIVFDDPLVNMDKERAESAAKLIMACSKRHQVIFLTCREEFANMLTGNKILLK